MKNYNLPKGIFFDFDGTLVNSIDLLYEAYQLFLEEHKLIPSKNEFDELNGPPLRIIIHKLKKKYGLQKSDEFLLTRFNEIIDNLYVNASLNIGANEIINTALDRSILLAIVSSNSRQRVNNWLSKNNLIDKFSFIISGDDVLEGKPNPEPYLLALSKANFSYNEVIAIEDSKQGVNSALNARIKTYMLNNDFINEFSAKKNITLINSFLDLNEILFL